MHWANRIDFLHLSDPNSHTNLAIKRNSNNIRSKILAKTIAKMIAKWGKLLCRERSGVFECEGGKQPQCLMMSTLTAATMIFFAAKTHNRKVRCIIFSEHHHHLSECRENCDAKITRSRDTFDYVVYRVRGEIRSIPHSCTKNWVIDGGESCLHDHCWWLRIFYMETRCQFLEIVTHRRIRVA